MAMISANLDMSAIKLQINNTQHNKDKLCHVNGKDINEHCLGNAMMLLSYTWYNCSTFIALVGEV